METITDDEEQLPFSSVIELNVGGTLLTTSVQTLTRCTGSLLASMFSSNCDILPRDKNGRYFIDGDGAMFIHILNFLRNNELPTGNISIRVYKAAVVLELRELIHALERVPPVLQFVCRENARSRIPGYQKFMSSLFDWIVDDCKSNLIGLSTFHVSLFKHTNNESKTLKLSETSNKTHICSATDPHTQQRVSADLYFGPWDSVIDLPESVMFDFMVSDVVEKGFSVSKHGSVSDSCEYRCLVKNMWKECSRKVFYLTIAWCSFPK